jgi:GT2 family glycosyltransferase
MREATPAQRISRDRVTALRIAFVCTNYNNAAVTEAAVRSLHGAAGDVQIRHVIVDNRSRDDELDRLRELAAAHDQVDLIESPTNRGYFRGLNLGLAHLRQRYPDHEYVVVGNNDLLFTADFVQQLERHREVLDEWAVVAPDLVTPEGAHQNPHVRVSISRWRKRVWRVHAASYPAAMAVRLLARLTRCLTARPENAPTSRHYLEPGPVEQGYGACYLLGPAFWRHFRRLAAPTFLMQEEFFLSEQLKLIGQSVYYDPRFSITHAGHATTGAIPSRRQWQFVHEAHRVYRHYESLSASDRRRFIERALEEAE